MGTDNEGIFNGIIGLCIRTIVNLVIVFVLVRGFVLGYTFTYRLFVDVPYMAGNNQSVTITIEDGESVSSLADTLYRDRIIEDKMTFLARVYIGRYDKKIKAGDYVINSTMSPDTLCRTFCGMVSEEKDESE